MTVELFEKEVCAYGRFEWLNTALTELTQTMEQDGGHDFGHLLRVLCNANQIAEKERGRGEVMDWEVIVASVIFHDAVNLPKNAPNRHEASKHSADFAANVLSNWFETGRIDLIKEAIVSHSFSSGLIPQSLEARIVCDADRLDSLGALGIARTFYVSGRMGRTIISLSDPLAVERELEDREYAVDHFFAKLLHLRDRMTTVSGRELAAQRHLFLESFLGQLKNELGL